MLEKDKELAAFALFLAKKNDSIVRIKTDLEKTKK